jgi:glycosyltransferase involved in cell wall biosynthesis
MSTAIAELLKDPERMRELGGRGRSRVRSDFHREQLMERLASVLKERFENAPGA